MDGLAIEARAYFFSRWIPLGRGREILVGGPYQGAVVSYPPARITGMEFDLLDEAIELLD
jgi:hypothetical protein